MDLDGASLLVPLKTLTKSNSRNHDLVTHLQILRFLQIIIRSGIHADYAQESISHATSMCEGCALSTRYEQKVDKLPTEDFAHLGQQASLSKISAWVTMKFHN